MRGLASILDEDIHLKSSQVELRRGVHHVAQRRSEVNGAYDPTLVLLLAFRVRRTCMHRHLHSLRPAVAASVFLWEMNDDMRNE